jgi:tol-pal system protein YbgF
MDISKGSTDFFRLEIFKDFLRKLPQDFGRDEVGLALEFEGRKKKFKMTQYLHSECDLFNKFTAFSIFLNQELDLLSYKRYAIIFYAVFLRRTSDMATHDRHKFTTWLVAGTCLGLILTGAAAQAYDPGIENRLDALEDKLNSMGRMPIGGNPSGGNLSALQVEVSRLQEELRSIRGGIEENRFGIEQIQREMKLAAEDYDYRLKALEDKTGGGGAAFSPDPTAAPVAPTAPVAPQATTPVTPPVAHSPQTTAPVATPATTAVMAPPAPTTSGVLGAYTTGGVPVAPTPPTPPIATPAPAAPLVSGSSFTDPAEHYNYAVSLVKNKQYEHARASFRGFVTAHPDHKLVGNAYYWLGETYYVSSDFVTAADTFRQGFEKDPNGIKAPDNLYKLAKSLLHINKKPEACIVLGQIQKRYKTRNPEVAGLAFETQKANSCQ